MNNLKNELNLKILNGFTLAETLITLGVIGVVAAITLPTLLTNIQEKVRQEQVRTIKYKFTKATDKMNSLGKIGHYDSSMDFVNELKKHMTIAKICDSENLEQCWGSSGFVNAKNEPYNVKDLKKAKNLDALQFNSGDVDTVGIVTGDGTPIILAYGKECTALDETKQYQWSVVNGKPETNATADCVSMVFDINGAKGPNKIGTDVRTMNSLLGMINLGENYTPLSVTECNKYKTELGINYCGGVENDRWAGAVKACHDLGLHLPSMTTLKKLVRLKYGIEFPTSMAWISFFDTQEECNAYLETLTASEKTFKTCSVKRESYSSPLLTSIGWNMWSAREATNTAYILFSSSTYSAQANEPKNYRANAICVGD